MRGDFEIQMARMAMVVFAGSAGLYAWGWRALRRRWVIANIPTSKARSVAMGMVELKGKAKCAGNEPTVSPVRGLNCVWYLVIADRTEGSGKNRRTRVLLRCEVGVPFHLEDDTGRVLVYPAGAEVTGIEVCYTRMGTGAGYGLEPSEDIRHFCDMNGIPWRSLPLGTDIRVREYVVLADADVYVLGEAGKVVDEAENRRRKISTLLREWLKAPARRAELDTNHDGILQPEEWDAARSEAQSKVLAEEMSAEGPAGPQVVVRKPRFGFFLIISGGEEEAIQAQGHPGFYITAGLALFGVGVWMIPNASLAWPAAWGGAAMGLVTVFGFLGRMRKR
jgi:hypothetical protein